MFGSSFDTSSRPGQMAAGSLIAGALSLFCGWVILPCSLPFPIVGAVMGIMALRGENRTWAIVGIVVNVFALLVMCLVISFASYFVYTHPELLNGY